jgi:hypothetical protein
LMRIDTSGDCESIGENQRMSVISVNAWT